MFFPRRSHRRSRNPLISLQVSSCCQSFYISNSRYLVPEQSRGIFIQRRSRKTSLVSDRNRTEVLNVKSSSQEPVSQFLKTLIIVELVSVGPQSFLLAALQISLLFLWMASLLHAALLCLSLSPPPRPASYLSCSVLPRFITELLLLTRLAACLSVCWTQCRRLCLCKYSLFHHV